MQITQTDQRIHISLRVSNIGEAVAFYSELFQATPAKVTECYARFRITTPPLHLSLSRTRLSRFLPKKIQRALDGHYGVEFFKMGELAQLESRISASRWATQQRKTVTCCYAESEQLLVWDPDGHRWEFWVRYKDTAEMCTTQDS